MMNESNMCLDERDITLHPVGTGTGLTVHVECEKAKHDPIEVPHEVNISAFLRFTWR